MKFYALAAATALSAGVTAVVPAATLNFVDTFATSTVNGASNPTATSTSYDVIANKPATATIAPGALNFSIPSTTGGINEIAARFTTTPLTLSAVGDFVQLQYTYTNGATTVTQFGSGLYNSGGSTPYTDLNTTANPLGNTTNTSEFTGGTAGWTGYVQNYQAAKTLFQSRPAQSLSSTQTQELIVNAFSGSAGYGGQTQVGSTSTSSVLTLAANTTYTEVMNVTLGAAGTVLTTSVFGGTSATGTPLATLTTTDGSNLYNTFDSLALGYGEKTAGANGFTLSALSVTGNTGGTTSPEPASLSLLGLGAVGMLRRRKA